MKVITDDFTAVGTIETVLDPEFQLRDGREVASVGFALITEDHRRFECQTDDGAAAFAKLQRIDISRLYRCKGYFQRMDGHPAFFVEDLHLSTSVGDRGGVGLEVEVKAEKRKQPLPPLDEIQIKALDNLRNCTKVELQALLAHYPERDIRHYALALDMSRRFEMPIPIAKNWVQCRRGHIFSVGTAGMLFKNRQTYCKDCRRDVSVVLAPQPKVPKEERIARQEGASEALQRLKTHGWRAKDSEATGKDDSGKSL